MSRTPLDLWAIAVLREERDDAGQLTRVRFVHRGRDVHAFREPVPDGSARWRVTVLGKRLPVQLAAATSDTGRHIAEQLVARGVTD